jgi:two-component sensor histidine kinase
VTDSIYKRMMTDRLVSGSPEALLAEANHRIANNLARIISIVRLQATHFAKSTRTMTAKEVSDLLSEFAGRIETVGRMHHLLSRSGRGALVEVGDYLHEVCRSLMSSLTSGRQAQLHHDFEGTCFLPADQLVLVGLIVTELVTNAVKYAHPSGVPTRIDVDCRQAPKGTLFVEVIDDGVGLPDLFDPTVDGGLGFRVMRALTDQLGGKLAFENDGLGLRASLVFDSACHDGGQPEVLNETAAVQ